ncbi:stress responsive protein [Bradyrhizobium canariense]|uniref:Dabb family protein n=1 Tax=Bradyrhizobium canariense TaxID=255045 RepID=UPI000A19123C|nr:Dabb family protein [Bradyrhizobium canariense]OSI73785.1 stress responsive protein [Bradyrhizobium canariense]
MIRHIVLFTAKDKADIDQIIEGLSVLTTIPHARRLEVARNRKTDQLGNDVDVVVYGEFDNETELAAYKAHDLYQESIRRVRPLREMRFAADYNVSIDAGCASRAAICQTTLAAVPTGGG